MMAYSIGTPLAPSGATTAKGLSLAMGRAAAGLE